MHLILRLRGGGSSKENVTIVDATTKKEKIVSIYTHETFAYLRKRIADETLLMDNLIFIVSYDKTKFEHYADNEKFKK